MTDLLTGSLALTARYVLILAAGALANAGLAIFDQGEATLTIRLVDVATAFAGVVCFAAALAWCWLAKRMGGPT